MSLGLFYIRYPCDDCRKDGGSKRDKLHEYSLCAVGLKQSCGPFGCIPVASCKNTHSHRKLGALITCWAPNVH